MKIFVYTHDVRSGVTQLMRYDDDDTETVELVKETAHVMDYACFDTTEKVDGEDIRFITLTPAMTPITAEQTWQVLAKLSRLGWLKILTQGQRIWL